MGDIWSTWLEDNYKYVLMAMQTTEEGRNNVMRLANICEKHGVSFKTVMDILTEWSGEDKVNA